MVGFETGFDENFFAALKKKLPKKNEFQRHGMVLFDEMQVRKAKYLSSKTMSYVGLSGDGDSATSEELADHALVFMFCPFGDSYVQPIGVFASKNASKGTLVAQLLLQAIVMLEEAGAKVHGFVCDGASTNRSMWNILGISGKIGNCKNFFENPSDPFRKIFAFSDVHLFKCIRNRLKKQRFLKKGGAWIKWSDYAAVYKQDLLVPAGLRVCPKITSSHIYPSNTEMMRVKLATQVFSRSMASGMEYYKERNVSELWNCDATKEFTLFLNDLFDAMNRRFKKGVTCQSSDFGMIIYGQKWLDEWEHELVNNAIVKDMFLTKSTSEGLRVTLQSTKDMCTFLTQSCNFG
ncbi:uncharacterized protein ISCGN_005736, partial [Ixodes scapularis]